MIFNAFGYSTFPLQPVEGAGHPDMLALLAKSQNFNS